MELAPGLHRLGDDLVASYLVIDGGVTVVDAGLPGHYRLLRRELDGLGLSLADVRGVVLTHGDSDHVGYAERLRRETGAPVFVHAADAARARGEESSSPRWGGAKLGPTLRFLVGAARQGGLRTTWLGEVAEIAGATTLDLPGAPRVIPMPGHSPGSIVVHVPAVGALFVGDALTTRHVLTGATGPAPAPFTDDPALAARSLGALEGIDAEWVLPGHGAPWTGGVPALLDAYRAAASAGQGS